MSHRVCMCNCQVLLDSEPTIVAVAHIVLDQTIPAALWLNLVSSESQESPPTYNSSRWVHTKNLPEVVEICAFPSWARSFVLPTAADVVADFLTSERLKESVWSTALAKAKLVVEDEEEEEEEGEEEEEEEEEPTGTRAPVQKPQAKRKSRGSRRKPAKRPRAGAVASGNDGPTQMETASNKIAAAELARYKAAEAKMVSEIAAYKRLDARANFRAEFEAEKQPSYDKDQEELVELRKAKLAAEIRTELKLEFKVKKKKLNQQLENSQEITTIAREGHQAEQAERIKDLNPAWANTRVPGFLKPCSPGVGCWVFRPSGTRVAAPAAKIFNIFNRGPWVTRGNPGVGCWVFYGFLVHKGEPGLSVCAVEAVVGACA